MVLPRLKNIRIVVSLTFLLITALVVLDFRNVVPPAVVRTILFLQFTPSALNFFTLAGTATIGFVVIIVLTLLFGRIYCSTICPLGTLQDIISFVSRKMRRKKFHEPLPSHSHIHLAFLVVTLSPLTVGTILAINLLDPFSNFGRIVGSLVRPVLIVANNGISSILEAWKYYDLYPVELKGVAIVSIAMPLLFLGIIVWMSYYHGRLYCNSVCPVGSLLRLLSRFSLLKIVIDADHCNGCQLCQRVCKAGCIDRKKKTVDFARCVDCFNCFVVCPSGGMKFAPSLGAASAEKIATDIQRRSFLFGSSLMFISQGIAKDTTKVVIPTKESTVPERKNYAVAPPGSRSIRQFTGTCTACHVCISSCPSHVLQPSFLEYGAGGILQPRMDFGSAYCNFECTVCTEVCPTGALRALTIEEKKTSQTGRAVFIRENCVVYTENTDCGACTEHCPTKAVTMVPYKNSRIPEVKSEYCIGCGACEHACPTRPYKAIYVDGNPVHLVAKKKPPEKKQEVILQEDFPF